MNLVPLRPLLLMHTLMLLILEHGTRCWLLLPSITPSRSRIDNFSSIWCRRKGRQNFRILPLSSCSCDFLSMLSDSMCRGRTSWQRFKQWKTSHQTIFYVFILLIYTIELKNDFSFSWRSPNTTAPLKSIIDQYGVRSDEISMVMKVVGILCAHKQRFDVCNEELCGRRGRKEF